MKVSVIGAGNVGATCAEVVARGNYANEVVLLDIKEGLAEGKSLDMWQTAPINYYSTPITGVTNNYEISVNAGIVKSVTEQVIKYSPDAIIIVVSNPLDVMSYCAYLTSGLPSNKVMGMAGILDTARYRAFLATEIGCSPKDIQALLMGGHGDTMVPLPRYTTVAGIPVTELVAADKLDAIINRTINGGGELVKLMGTSAWYAPGSAAAQMVESIVRDEKRIYPVCAWLTGEYGLSDVYLGVPAVLGKNGIERIIEVDLNEAEKALLHKSAGAVKEVMSVFDQMNA